MQQQTFLSGNHRDRQREWFHDAHSSPGARDRLRSSLPSIGEPHCPYRRPPRAQPSKPRSPTRAPQGLWAAREQEGEPPGGRSGPSSQCAQAAPAPRDQRAALALSPTTLEMHWCPTVPARGSRAHHGLAATAAPPHSGQQRPPEAEGPGKAAAASDCSRRTLPHGG